MRAKDDRLYFDAGWVKPEDVVKINIPYLPAADGCTPSLPEGAGFGAARGGGKTGTLQTLVDEAVKSAGSLPHGTPDGVPLQAEQHMRDSEFAPMIPLAHDPATCWWCLNQGKIG